MDTTLWYEQPCEECGQSMTGHEITGTGGAHNWHWNGFGQLVTVPIGGGKGVTAWGKLKLARS